MFQLLLLISLVYVSCDSFQNDTFESDLNDFRGYRLPNDTKPISYDLDITTKVHQNDFLYKGTVAINIRVLNNTNEIVLHAYHSLNIIKVSLVDTQTGTKFENLTSKRNSRNDFFVIYSKPEPLQLTTGKEYVLTLSFDSSLENDKGFYYSPAVLCDTDGDRTDTVWMASTFFEPYFARTAFPCFDEPQLKAPFKISITHGSNYTALSNMPADSDPIKIDEHMVTTKFKETPPISTYTVAFVVGFIDKISVDIDNITSNVYAQRGCPFEDDLLLEVAAKTLNALGKYFEVGYPLPKMDHIRVDGLPASAVENWGLIIYNSPPLLKHLRDKKDDLSIANVVAHEIAHQWFGNLVTPKWWNYIWLNEGIASYYSHKVLDMVYPDLKTYETQILLRERDEWIDFEKQPMNVYTEDKYDIWSGFRKVFYWKGNQIIRMFEHAIGEETFKKGMTKYLRRYQYSSVEENDLFECLQEAASEDMVPEFEKKGTVAKIMSSWTNQMHYPILKVARDPRTNDITFTQHPITNNGNNTDPRLWWIPISIATASNPDFNITKPNFILQNKRSHTINLSDIGVEFDGEKDWLIVNKQCTGFYRVIYDDSNYHKIIEALKKDKTLIHSYNKAQIIRDAAYFVGHKMLSHSILFKLYNYLEDDTDIIAWSEFLADFHYHQSEMQASGGRYYFDYFFNKISQKVMEKVGTESRPNDSAFMRLVRHHILATRCEVDISNCHIGRRN